jgi:hypothetical protein
MGRAAIPVQMRRAPTRCSAERLWNRDESATCELSAARVRRAFLSLSEDEACDCHVLVLINTNVKQAEPHQTRLRPQHCISGCVLCNRCSRFSTKAPIISRSRRSPAAVLRTGVSQSGKACTGRVDATQAHRATFAVHRDNSSPSPLGALTLRTHFLVSSTRLVPFLHLHRRKRGNTCLHPDISAKRTTWRDRWLQGRPTAAYAHPVPHRPHSTPASSSRTWKRSSTSVWALPNKTYTLPAVFSHQHGKTIPCSDARGSPRRASRHCI